jgi:hypothetical protein
VCILTGEVACNTKIIWNRSIRHLSTLLPSVSVEHQLLATAYILGHCLTSSSDTPKAISTHVNLIKMFSNKRGRKFGDTACIFVHAGAGYHSVANEMIHLAACNE